MKFNGSSNFYIMDKHVANNKRLDAFENSVSIYLPNCEKHHYTSKNGSEVDIICVHNNYDDSKMFLKRILSDSGLLGVDILLISFLTIFRGDRIRTAYKIAYTCGARIFEYNIYDLEPHGSAKLDLVTEINKLPMSSEMRSVLDELYIKKKIEPLFENKAKIKYKAER